MKTARWFDSACLAELERRGWPRLSPAQSLLFAHLGDASTAPAELARRLGQSRQAVHGLVAGLCRLGLLEVADDPDRRGGRRVRLTDSGVRLVRDAYAVLMQLEAEIGSRSISPLRPRLLDLLSCQQEVDRRDGSRLT